MQNEAMTLEIPYGTRDFLPSEAAEKRAIEDKIAALFAVWGYDEVVTPTIEYLDTLISGNGSALEQHMFKLFDKDNRSLALRHEMTTPIARLFSSRLRGGNLPVRLSYISSVYRYEQAQTGRQCEFYQAGVELLGSAGASADAEVVALAIESLKQAGLQDFQVCLGQVDFITGIMQQFDLDQREQEAIKKAVEKHDLVALQDIVSHTKLSVEAKKIINKIPLLHGTEEILAQAYDMALHEQGRRALDNLANIYRLLKVYGLAEHVCFDLGVIRDFNYYTGMVFEIYTSGLGFPICGGGRYDHMLSDFGTDCPATGFALGIERIMLALERQGLPRPKSQKDIYLSYALGKEIQAVQEAGRLRGQGMVVELSLQPQTEAEANEEQNGKEYDKLVYIS